MMFWFSRKWVGGNVGASERLEALELVISVGLRDTLLTLFHGGGSADCRTPALLLARGVGTRVKERSVRRPPFQVSATPVL